MIELVLDDATFKRVRRAIETGTLVAALDAYDAAQDARAEARRLMRPDAPVCPTCGHISEGERMRLGKRASRVHYCKRGHEWILGSKL